MHWVCLQNPRIHHWKSLQLVRKPWLGLGGGPGQCLRARCCGDAAAMASRSWGASALPSRALLPGITLALKEGRERPPLCSQVSLLRALIPRPLRLGRCMGCARQAGAVLAFPYRAAWGTAAPWHQTSSSSSSSSALPCSRTEPCSLRSHAASAGPGGRSEALLPPLVTAPPRHCLTCFDCSTCNS